MSFWQFSKHFYFFMSHTWKETSDELVARVPRKNGLEDNRSVTIFLRLSRGHPAVEWKNPAVVQSSNLFKCQSYVHHSYGCPNESYGRQMNPTIVKWILRSCSWILKLFKNPMVIYLLLIYKGIYLNETGFLMFKLSCTSTFMLNRQL
jgi:hypothetical protein